MANSLDYIAKFLNYRAIRYGLLLVLPFALYANNFRHAYHLDDAYTVVTNPSIRSLGNIPSYFADPGTLTSNREQADYRPILQITYALNYWMGGYDTWWWHFTQVLFHAFVTLGIYALARRILVLLGDPRPDGIALFAAIVFAVHPTASGVVNYFNARSSLLTAVFLLPALLAYLKSIDDARYSRPQWATATLYALALFSKVEAVGALGAFWAYELWQRGRETPGASLLTAARASLDRRTLRRLAPALAVTAVYFVIRWRVMAPYPFDETRHAADVGAYQYFLTQLTAWWYYVLQWLVPVRLVADYLAYPVFRSWTHPVVLLAGGAWLAVVALLVAAWKRAPYLLFLAVAALALLSPTSSIAPLAEMVNEHRPYLPMGILSLALLIPAGLLVRGWSPARSTRTALAAGVAVILVALCGLTYRRNEVFSTGRRYWQDVLEKAPSARAHLNYGLALMQGNDIAGAMRHYRQSLDLAPWWHFTHINLGVAHNHLGQTDSARAHFDEAVSYDRHSGMALTWRGEFRLAQRDFAGARDDFLASLPVGLQRYRNTKGLATAYAGLGDAQQALEQTQRMIDMDSATAVVDVRAVATPFFQNAALHGAGMLYYAGLQARLPGRPWIAENIARLNALAGATGRQVQLSGRPQTARPSQPATQETLMSDGLARLRANDPAGAAAAFRRVLSLNAMHYGAHYQLAVALDRLGQSRDARAYWEKVLRMAEGYNDRATIQAARARLARTP